MASPVDTPFTPVSVECPRCHAKQTVHVAVREGSAPVGDQRIPCAGCRGVFSVLVLDRIVGGPFLS
jgi:transposase-like protein